MSATEIKINDKDENKDVSEEPVKSSSGISREKKRRKTGRVSEKDCLKKLKEAEEKARGNYDLYMRTYAEIENIKRRGTKEKEDLRKFANESLIKEILPVVDNLQQALSHAVDDSSGLAEGVRLVLDGLMKTLKKSGTEEVKSEGELFDPNFHEAISMQNDDNVPKGHVLKELQRGYILNGRLIRPSKVIISQGNCNG